MTSDFPKCDLLIVIGTSLKVHPFASLVNRVSDDVPRVLINMEKVGTASVELLSRGIPTTGFNFGEGNYRDVFLKGDCDSQCKLMSEMLGWKDELDKLVEAGRNKTKSIALAADPAAVAAKATEEKPVSANL